MTNKTENFKPTPIFKGTDVASELIDIIVRLVHVAETKAPKKLKDTNLHLVIDKLAGLEATLRGYPKGNTDV